jgi:hypothetical protein
MRMRQSQAQLERAFAEETQLDRHRRESLREAAIQRSKRRRADRETKRSSMRFGVLALILLATAVLVTVAMFRALYVLLG